MGALRTITLAAVLSLTSCGALRWAFAHDDETKPSRAERAVQVIAENGTDPGKWIGWLVGAVVGGGAGFAGGRWTGKERRSGLDRRVSSSQLGPGADSP